MTGKRPKEIVKLVKKHKISKKEQWIVRQTQRLRDAKHMVVITIDHDDMASCGWWNCKQSKLVYMCELAKKDAFND